MFIYRPPDTIQINTVLPCVHHEGKCVRREKRELNELKLKCQSKIPRASYCIKLHYSVYISV